MEILKYLIIEETFGKFHMDWYKTRHEYFELNWINWIELKFSLDDVTSHWGGGCLLYKREFEWGIKKNLFTSY